MRLAENRLLRGTVGLAIVVEHALVIGVPARENDAESSSTKDEIAIAHAIVRTVVAALEILLDLIEPQTVLVTRGVGREPRAADLTGVVLQGLEVAVGERDQLRARTTLRRRHHPLHPGVALERIHVAEGRRWR